MSFFKLRVLNRVLNRINQINSVSFSLNSSQYWWFFIFFYKYLNSFFSHSTWMSFTKRDKKILQYMNLRVNLSVNKLPVYFWLRIQTWCVMCAFLKTFHILHKIRINRVKGTHKCMSFINKRVHINAWVLSLWVSLVNQDVLWQQDYTYS